VIFAAITLCVASQRVSIAVSLHFFVDSVRKLLDTPSYIAASGRSTWKCYTPGVRGEAMADKSLI
jgi:hypothetical protein